MPVITFPQAATPRASVYPSRAGASSVVGDREFIKVLDLYRSHGGLARSHEVVARSVRQLGPNAASFASWIGERQVISFLWQAQIWMPLFQFNRFDMMPAPKLRQVLVLLNTALDSWEVAAWFITEHTMLSGRPPAALLARDPALVLRAAQALPR
jgi:hypothetical protein